MKKNKKENDRVLSDKEFQKFEGDRMVEMPTNILNKAIELLKKEIDAKTQDEIRESIKDNPLYWFAPYHFGWGMAIRNLLRDKVCLDNKLPSGTWDDYYVQIIEIVVHARMYS
jgi:hypothetical protein